MNLKEKPPNKWVIFVSAFCLGILLNCISFVKYENPSLANTPNPEFTEKKTILLKYYGDYLLNGKYSKTYQHLPILKENMVDTLKDTNLFQNIVTDENQAHDYVMYYESDVNEKSSMVLAFLSGLTVLLFPLSIDLDRNIKISIYDTKNKLLATNQEKVNTKHYAGWILIPVSPFFFTPVVEKNTVRNILFNAMNQWKSKGIIK
ncbi:hypothetical protein [Leptospira brenneri]|uniref:Lipoprotein n=1 Tax=Leptospira brenneri TaxID=2023182 RepID=A0A2M9Y5D2_9LEPT|nr:hypothetical protein [Leptospira brenneri]PJZ46765.1 hypothetical protein CH361_05570 [Leptospira brenneri]TGK96656.1 hypothetical protein EHQ30_08680 [Leptospira brenneri]